MRNASNSDETVLDQITPVTRLLDRQADACLHIQRQVDEADPSRVQMGGVLEAPRCGVPL